MENMVDKEFFVNAATKMGYYVIDENVNLLKVRIYTDQDGYKHKIFYKDEDRMISNETLSEIYTNTFLTGNICHIRSEKYHSLFSKYCLSEADGFTFLTIASVIAEAGNSKRLIKVFGRLLGWLNDENY